MAFPQNTWIGVSFMVRVSFVATFRIEGGILVSLEPLLDPDKGPLKWMGYSRLRGGGGVSAGGDVAANLVLGLNAAAPQQFEDFQYFRPDASISVIQSGLEQYFNGAMALVGELKTVADQFRSCGTSIEKMKAKVDKEKDKFVANMKTVSEKLEGIIGDGSSEVDRKREKPELMVIPLPGSPGLGVDLSIGIDKTDVKEF